MLTTKLRALLLAWVLALGLPVPVSASESNKPQRIVSLNTCTDQVLLMLVEPERIAAVSHLALNPVYSYMAEQAKQLTVHYGYAEEIMPMRPDLIIGSTFSRHDTVKILRALKQNVKTYSSPTTLEEVEIYTRQIGEAVGEPARAEAIIHAMHQELATSQQKTLKLPQQAAVIYGPNGFTAGRKTLKHEILEAAGYRNLSADLGIQYYGNLSVEQLISARPDVVIIDEDIPNDNSLAQGYLRHPALIEFLGERGLTRIPTNHWLCPGPLFSKAVSALVAQR